MTARNLDRLLRKLDRLPATLERRIGDSLEASAAEMLGYAVVRIQKNSGSGRAYKRGKRVHIASAPGEYPNSDFGNLVRSLFSRRTGPGSAEWGSRSVIAAYLEFGTSRMLPRPFLRPTMNALKAKASANALAAANEAMKEAKRG